MSKIRGCFPYDLQFSTDWFGLLQSDLKISTGAIDTFRPLWGTPDLSVENGIKS